MASALDGGTNVLDGLRHSCEFRFDMARSRANPITECAKRQRVMVLDGGLATTLEARGWDLDDELWSAKILLEAPDEIQQVHHDFLVAGADCITTSSYQASLPGFRRRGISETQGIELLHQSVRLATNARDAFWSESANCHGRRRPLVAASVGPFGAFLADGSEYTGAYQISDNDLYEFHRTRWHVLAESAADLLACETIPSRQEAGVLMRLLRETPGRWAWLSFSCRDTAHMSDGTRLTDVVRLCDSTPNLAAVGINCTRPEFIAPLLTELRQATGKPLIVYPNSGEQYDARSRTWTAQPSTIDWQEAAAGWVQLGAVGVGGCCRVGPAQIANLRHQLVVP